MNKTENKFKNYCTLKKYFCRKLQTHTATGYGTCQVSDFIVGNDNGIYFVECKERAGKSFEFEGLSQMTDMILLSKRSKKALIYILINFYNENIIVFLPLNEYLTLMDNASFNNGKKKKSININDFPDKYKSTWKTLDF